MDAQERKEEEKVASLQIPEGFFEFFKSEALIPDAPNPEAQLVELQELGISFHYSYALHRVGSAGHPKREFERIREALKSLPLYEAPDLEFLDNDVYFPGERNCVRGVFGPIEVRVRPLKGVDAFVANCYIIATLYDAGVITLSLTLPLPHGVTGGKLTPDQIQDLTDAYFYNRKKFTIKGVETTLTDFFSQLRNSITTAIPDLASTRALRYVSVIIKKTNPGFTEARKFVMDHAYEIIAMLGEEADWRDAAKSTVREILCFGLQCKECDVVVPQEFASVAFDGSPGPGRSFETLGIHHFQLLDIHHLAASSAFMAVRKLIDRQIEACTKATEKDYPRLIKDINSLLSRYINVKQSFTNIDHIWTDKAFAQYVNYHLELYTPTRKAARGESLDKAMDIMRGLTAQMAEIVQRETGTRTNLSLQLVSLFLSGAVILDLVKLAADTYHFDAVSQLTLGLGLWATIALLILVFWIRRRWVPIRPP